MKQITVVLFSEINSKFGGPFLSKLLQHPLIAVCGLVTTPEGRLCSYYVDEPDPVDLQREAQSQGIPVLRPSKVNEQEVIDALANLSPDYFLIANYQQIFRAPLLEVPQYATINFHPSPLPRYAGWAPFFWMAKQGEKHGGVSALLANKQIDGGPLIAQKTIELTGTETAIAIRDSHFAASFALLDEVLPLLIQQSFQPMPQDLSRRSYYGKPSNEDYWIDFAAEQASILQTVRAGYRHPGAYAITDRGEHLHILSIEPAGLFLQTREAPPGTILRSPSGVFVAIHNGWVRINTIEQNGCEVPCTPTHVTGLLSFRSSLVQSMLI